MIIFKSLVLLLLKFELPI